MKRIQRIAIVLFLVMASNNVWLQNSKQITRGSFMISKGSINEVDLTKTLKEFKAFTVFYFNNTDNTIYMANVWEGNNSQSSGPIEITNSYTTKSEENGYREHVYHFSWNFRNTYNKKRGIVDVVFVKSYQPNGIYVSLYVKQKNNDLTIYEGYIEKDFNLYKE